jgi:hypothetical protein
VRAARHPIRVVHVVTCGHVHLRPDLERVRKGSALRRVPAADPVVDRTGRAHTLPAAAAPPPNRPREVDLHRPRGPRYATMLKDWKATGTPAAFRARLERRLRKAGLIQPRHDDDAIDKLLDAGSIDAPVA